VTPPDYEYLRKLLKDHSGLDLSADKQYLIESRLLPLSRKCGVPGIGELVQKMKGGSSSIIAQVVEAMTTNETFFFRDKVPFDHFRDAIMPEMLKARANRKSIRIWCAAGSTGQEPYSLASLKKWARRGGGSKLSTDLSQEVLEKSKAGIYSQFEVQRGLPIQMLVKYFKQTGELWQINPDIRAMVQHRHEPAARFSQRHLRHHLCWHPDISIGHESISSTVPSKTMESDGFRCWARRKRSSA
jgi:chemotaxis protein methyltransferase CheR